MKVSEAAARAGQELRSGDARRMTILRRAVREIETLDQPKVEQDPKVEVTFERRPGVLVMTRKRVC